MIKTYDDEHAAIFPLPWRVNEVLANAFCESTRDDFKGILSRSVRSGQTIDVNLLLSCLQETLDFEHSLDRRFARTSRVSTDTVASSTDSPISMHSISEAFEPYLGLWVEAQDKQLAALLPKYRQQPLKREDEEFRYMLCVRVMTLAAECSSRCWSDRLLLIFHPPQPDRRGLHLRKAKMLYVSVLHRRTVQFWSSD